MLAHMQFVSMTTSRAQQATRSKQTNTIKQRAASNAQQVTNGRQMGSLQTNFIVH
jgi:hypothetical protein